MITLENLQKRGDNMKKNLNLKSKILIINISLIVLLGLSIFTVVLYQVNKLVVNNIDTTAEGYVNLAKEILDNKYPGDWSVNDDKLFKGNELINNNTEFVDNLKETTNSVVTIFLNDTRISTNIMSEGERVIGTKAPIEATDKVLKNGEVFTGEVEVIGTKYEAKYVPIKDSNNKIIGMLFLGVEKSVINNQVFNLMSQIGLIILLVIAVAIIITVIFTNSITRNVKKIVDSLNEISKGDLTEVCKVSAGDETGLIAENLNSMSKNVANLITELKRNYSNLQENAENLSSVSELMALSSEQVSNSIQDIAGGANNQAEELIEITSIFNKFSEELEKIVVSIRQTEVNSKSIEDMASESNKEMNYVIESLNHTSNSFKDLMDKISKLGEGIAQINEITTFINSIADQTNLLALNAAIEAARVGEEGRGFAIVSDEIRKLAEQTKISSKNINDLIGNISKESKVIIESSGNVDKELNNQVSVINTTVESFKKIIKSVDNIIPMIDEANKSAIVVNKEQNFIIEKIEETSSIAEEVSASSEEIAASSEEMSASTQEVNATAKSLMNMTLKIRELIDKFKV